MECDKSEEVNSGCVCAAVWQLRKCELKHDYGGCFPCFEFFLVFVWKKREIKFWLEQTRHSLVVRCHSRHSGDAIDELGAIEHVCILEHAVLERHNNKLTLFEVTLQHRANILRVGQIECGVDLVQNINWRRLQQQHRQDKTQRHQRALAARQLGQVIFPNVAKADLDSLVSYLIIQWRFTLNSKPSKTDLFSGGRSWAVAPGNSDEKIDPKFLLTWTIINNHTLHQSRFTHLFVRFCHLLLLLNVEQLNSLQELVPLVLDTLALH